VLAPQTGQNLASSGTSVPHFAQNMIGFPNRLVELAFPTSLQNFEPIRILMLKQLDG
jgi:hypothetical protein